MTEIGEDIFVRGTGHEIDSVSDIWDDTALIHAYDNAVSVMKAKLSEGNLPSGLSGNYKETSNAHKKKKKKKKQQNNKTQDTQWKAGDHCRVVYTEDGEIYEALIISVDRESSHCTVRYLGYGNEEDHDVVDLLPSEAVKSKHIESLSDTQSGSDTGIELQHQEMHFHQTRPRGGSRRSSSGSLRGGGAGGGRGRSRPSRQPTMFAPHGPPTANWPNFPLPPPPPMGLHLPPPPPQWQGMANNPFPDPFSGAVPFTMPPIPHMPPPPQIDDDNDLETDKDALYSMLISWYMSGYHTGHYQGLKEGKKLVKRTSSKEKPDNPDEKS